MTINNLFAATGSTLILAALFLTGSAIGDDLAFSSSKKSDRLVTRYATQDITPAPTENLSFDLIVNETVIDGTPQVWMEVIDKFDEVIYQTNLRSNETHLLQGGGAIAITPKAKTPDASKTIKDRISHETKTTESQRKIIETGTQTLDVEVTSQYQIADGLKFGKNEVARTRISSAHAQFEGTYAKLDVAMVN